MNIPTIYTMNVAALFGGYIFGFGVIFVVVIAIKFLRS
jgi:hypothetical protein